MEYNNTTFIPRFLSCSDYERPELKFIVHTKFPRMIVKLIEGYEKEDLLEVRENRLLFVMVSITDNTNDLLVLADLIDNVDLGQSAMYEKVYNSLEQMSHWHREERNTREAYQSS